MITIWLCVCLGRRSTGKESPLRCGTSNPWYECPKRMPGCTWGTTWLRRTSTWRSASCWIPSSQPRNSASRKPCRRYFNDNGEVSAGSSWIWSLRIYNLRLSPYQLIRGTNHQSFRKYLTFKRDHNELLLFLLRVLVKEALHYEEIISGTGDRLTHIQVKVEDLRNKVSDCVCI